MHQLVQVVDGVGIVEIDVQLLFFLALNSSRIHDIVLYSLIHILLASIFIILPISTLSFTLIILKIIHSELQIKK